MLKDYIFKVSVKRLIIVFVVPLVVDLYLDLLKDFTYCLPTGNLRSVWQR